MTRNVTLVLEGSAETINNMLDEIERAVCDIANSTEEEESHIYMLSVVEA